MALHVVRTAMLTMLKGPASCIEAYNSTDVAPLLCPAGERASGSTPRRVAAGGLRVGPDPCCAFAAAMLHTRDARKLQAPATQEGDG